MKVEWETRENGLLGFVDGRWVCVISEFCGAVFLAFPTGVRSCESVEAAKRIVEAKYADASHQ